MKYIAKATYKFEADVAIHGDTAIETVRLMLPRNKGSYVIHREEFPSNRIRGIEPQYVENMLNSVIRMAGNQLRTDGIR